MKLFITLIAAALGGAALAQNEANQRYAGSVAPHGFSIARGNLMAGGIWDLIHSDNIPMVLSAGPNMGGFPSQVILEGRLPVDPTQLSFAVESNTTSPNIEQTVALWDFDARNWVIVGSDILWSYDNVRDYAVTDPILRFSEAGSGRVRALIAFRPVGRTYGLWQTRIDAAGWRYVE